MFGGRAGKNSFVRVSGAEGAEGAEGAGGGGLVDADGVGEARPAHAGVPREGKVAAKRKK